MWTKIRKIAGRYEIRPAADSGTLFVTDETAELVLPPVDRSVGVELFALPIGSGVVELSGADDATRVDVGGGPVAVAKFSGQQIITILPLDCWRAIGYPTPANVSNIVPTTEPEPKPEPRSKSKK